MYSKSFYSNNKDFTKESAGIIVELVLGIYKPSSVIDLGSSSGVFLKEFMDHGINDVLGVDGPWIPEEFLLIPKDKFLRQDIEEPLIVGRKFDLAISLEVLEHVNNDKSLIILEEITDLADVILFSAAAPGQGGTHHVNERWPSFWAAKFSDLGYKCIDLRPFVWNNDKILPWYRQNMMLFVRDSTTYDEIIGELENYESCYPLSLIHPDMTFTSLLNLRNSFFTQGIIKIATIGTRIVRAYAIRKKSKTGGLKRD